MNESKANSAVITQTVIAVIFTLLAVLMFISSYNDRGHIAWWTAPLWAVSTAIWTWVAVLKERTTQLYKGIAQERVYGGRR